MKKLFGFSVLQGLNGIVASWCSWTTEIKLLFVANIIANTVCILLKVKFVLALSGISFIIAAGQQTIFLIHLRFLVRWFHGSMVQSSMKKQPISNLVTSANHWLAFKILCLAVANQQCFYNEWISRAQYKLCSIRERVTIEVSFIDNLYFFEPFFAHVLWLVDSRKHSSRSWSLQ